MPCPLNQYGLDGLEFWQRQRENRRVYDHLQHWHKISRSDVDEATDDVINGLLKNGKEPGNERR